MAEPASPRHCGDAIVSMLSRSGTTLANLDPGRSLLFLLLTITPKSVAGILWKRQGTQYRRSRTTISEVDYQRNSRGFEQAFGALSSRTIRRLKDVLEITTLPETYLYLKIAPVEIKLTYGATLVANSLILLPLDDGKELVELYVEGEISHDELDEVHDAGRQIYESLRSRLIQIYSVLSSEDEAYPDFRELHGEQRLFRQIFRDMKSWFGEDFHTVNIFTFNPLDRMLYHLETSNLKLDKEIAEKYRPTPEISLPRILDYIKGNIDRFAWPADAKPELLGRILYDLREKKQWRTDGLKQDAKALKALLTVMPQEPGTGIAGHTALTRIPELGLDTSDPRWQIDTPEYSGTFFAAMLSVEQMFGIGSGGNKMAAVPLMESGQFWGVLFFVQREVYTPLRLLALWERAQHLSAVLSLFRSFQFQNAIIKTARDYPQKSVAQLALRNIHLALNPILAVHWQLHGRKKGGLDQVEYWLFDGETARFGEGGTETGKQGYFKSARIRSRVLKRIDRGKVEILQYHDDLDEEETGLPKSFDYQHRDLIRSAIMIPVPPDDLLAIYTDEECETLKPFRTQFEDRFSCLWDIEKIRRGTFRANEFITQSKLMKTILEAIDNAALTNVSILLLGERGTGKELIASRVHQKSIRSAQPFRPINVSALTKEMAAEELFGHVKSSHSTAFTNKIGEFEKADGGTTFLDEIGNLGLDVQGVLLRVLQFGEIRPVGGDPKRIDVRVVAATNRPLQNMTDEGSFLPDLLDRFKLVFTIPPLRDHPEDIPLLARHFAQRNKIRLSADAIAALWNHNWPGNTRKLEDLIETLAIFFPGSTITRDTLRAPLLRQLPSMDLPDGDGANGPVVAKKIQPYIGLSESEDDACRGWALFSEATYDVDEDPKEDWTGVTLPAFQKLSAKGIKVNSYCSVGCGAALDALIAMNIWECKQVRLADINGEILPIAQENVYLNAPVPVQVDITEGAFFDKFDQQKFDLIYENLPNLPWTGTEDLGGRDWATFYRLQGPNPAAADKWLLSTHGRFLEKASNYLEPEGRVVCCIGARVPWESVQEMFDSRGFVPELIHFGIKKQQQVNEVVGGYAKAEDQNEPFMFLDLNATRELLSQTQDSSAPDKLRKLVMRSEEFEGVRLTASAALKEHEKGLGGAIIGHGVYVVSGKLKK